MGIPLREWGPHPWPVDVRLLCYITSWDEVGQVHFDALLSRTRSLFLGKATATVSNKKQQQSRKEEQQSKEIDNHDKKQHAHSLKKSKKEDFMQC